MTNANGQTVETTQVSTVTSVVPVSTQTAAAGKGSEQMTSTEEVVVSETSTAVQYVVGGSIPIHSSGYINPISDRDRDKVEWRGS